MDKRPESAHFWLSVLDQLKSRGVQDILIACMDGLKGLENAIEAVYPQTRTQRCILHMIRNSTKYEITKDCKRFCQDLKEVYHAVSLDSAQSAFKKPRETWGTSNPLAVRVCENNIEQVYQLFEFPQEIRKVIYTTNAIESYNSQLRKVSNGKGAFPYSLPNN